MSRRSLLVGAAALAALGSGATAAWWQRHPTVADDGIDIWSQRLQTPDGDELIVSRLRGRPLLLNFWATWCAPCITELPLLDAFARAEAGRWNVVALAIDNVSAVQRFLASRNFALQTAWSDAKGLEIARSLGNVHAALPFSAVFARSGKLFESRSGQIDERLLERWKSALD